MIFLRIITKPNVNREKINDLETKYNWTWEHTTTASEEKPFEQIWSTRDKQTAIHYIEDKLIDVCYFFIEGRENEVISNIKSSLEIFDEKEICQMFESAVEKDEYVQATYYLGVAAPPYIVEKGATPESNPEFLELFKRAFSHSEVDVRRAAIIAACFAGWREFRELLEKLKNQDVDSEIRYLADVALTSLSNKNWQEAK